MIERVLQSVIETRMFHGKAIIIVGPRQVGKTTLLNILRSGSEHKVIHWNCDEPDIRQKLTNPTSTRLRAEMGSTEILMIDEAQRVQNIGITLKLLTDNFPEKQIIVTGSSALDLSDSINEPLTGRKYEYTLYPMSAEELTAHFGVQEERRMLEYRLIYGSYPDVINNPEEAREILSNITSSYLYKDIFAFQDVRKPEIIEQLLQALALQIGSEVSFNELGRMLGLNSLTVQRYLNLLEKSYVIFHLRSFSRNVRAELKKSRKIYFYDNGIRNALIGDFKPLNLRQDTGALWENYVISERMKHNGYHQFYGRCYFWRTQQQQEIDYLEDMDGVLHAYEFKWNQERKVHLTETFAKSYPKHTFTIVHPDNFLNFVCGNE
jgi:predicted AAA+ superfamily ATPase